MKRKKLSHNLQYRVRRYLDYVWENKKKNKLEEKQVLILLSEPLRDEIYSHIHGVVIKYCKIFSQYETNFISQLARTLISETFAPGDIILEEGEFSNKMYFIMSGKIRIYQAETKTVFKELSEKEYFGEISFFTNNPRCASAHSIDFVDVLSLTRANFNALSEKFPESLNVTSKIEKKCENNDFSDLNLECYICEQKGHYSTKCHFFIINLDQEDTKKKWLEQKNRPEARLVGKEQFLSGNFQRKERKVKRLRGFSSKNIIGIPRSVSGISDPQIFPVVRERVFRESSTGDSVEHLSNVRVNFAELYANSEEYPSSNSLREDENIRKASFRLSLIRKSFIEDPDSEFRRSQRSSRTSILKRDEDI
jgi:hypothetical protein